MSSRNFRDLIQEVLQNFKAFTTKKIFSNKYI